MADLLHVGDESFDPEDLTFKEKREIRRLVRTELWDEDLMGEFDWAEVPQEEIIAATVCVFMRRSDPSYTLDQALELKPRDVMAEDLKTEDEDELPPTEPDSEPKPEPPSTAPASVPTLTSVESGVAPAA